MMHQNMKKFAAIGATLAVGAEGKMFKEEAPIKEPYVPTKAIGTNLEQTVKTGDYVTYYSKTWRKGLICRVDERTFNTSNIQKRGQNTLGLDCLDLPGIRYILPDVASKIKPPSVAIKYEKYQEWRYEQELKQACDLNSNWSTRSFEGDVGRHLSNNQFATLHFIEGEKYRNLAKYRKSREDDSQDNEYNAKIAFSTLWDRESFDKKITSDDGQETIISADRVKVIQPTMFFQECYLRRRSPDERIFPDDQWSKFAKELGKWKQGLKEMAPLLIKTHRTSVKAGRESLKLVDRDDSFLNQMDQAYDLSSFWGFEKYVRTWSDWGKPKTLELIEVDIAAAQKKGDKKSVDLLSTQLSLVTGFSDGHFQALDRVRVGRENFLWWAQGSSPEAILGDDKIESMRIKLESPDIWKKMNGEYRGHMSEYYAKYWESEGIEQAGTFQDLTARNPRFRCMKEIEVLEADKNAKWKLLSVHDDKRCWKNHERKEVVRIGFKIQKLRKEWHAAGEHWQSLKAQSDGGEEAKKKVAEANKKKEEAKKAYDAVHKSPERLPLWEAWNDAYDLLDLKREELKGMRK